MGLGSQSAIGYLEKWAGGVRGPGSRESKKIFWEIIIFKQAV
jgi:hypothetical protein